MDINMLTNFFLWCTIINGALLLLWVISWKIAPDMVYRTQFKWFPIPRESFNKIFYSFLGLFKIVFLVFNLVPLIVLMIME